MMELIVLGLAVMGLIIALVVFAVVRMAKEGDMSDQYGCDGLYQPA